MLNNGFVSLKAIHHWHMEVNQDCFILLLRKPLQELLTLQITIDFEFLGEKMSKSLKVMLRIINISDPTFHFYLLSTKAYLPTSSQRRSEEHTCELQSRPHLVCRLLLE